jgi:hypothetical protein
LIRHYYLPSHAAQPGDTWPVHHECPLGSARILERVLVRDFKVTFQGWETHGRHLCARLEFEGTEKTMVYTILNASGLATPSTEGAYSGVAWFDPELGRVLEVISTRDFKVTSNKPVNRLTNPTAVGPFQSVTDQHHQVIAEKLISVEEPS